jgi:AbiJ N-terminal domain 4
MSSDSPKKPFSKRYGYRSQPREIAIRDDAPENLRHFVLETARELDCRPSTLRTLICSVLHVRPDPSNWAEYPNVWGEVQNLAYGCEWFKFYDFVENISHSLGASTAEADLERRESFADSLNSFFVDEGIGWQIVEGEILTRGSEIFEANVHRAAAALEVAHYITARDEIHEALNDLSRRPEPDLTGALQHSMAALECVAREVCGNERATLGEIIKYYPGVIPKPLDESVAKAWGYASEMARHIREGRKPERKEVELIVNLAATVATYLSI